MASPFPMPAESKHSMTMKPWATWRGAVAGCIAGGRFLLAFGAIGFGAALMFPAPVAAGEVRGTWLTTTANDALANPQATAESMRRLREMGLNTVYVEAWKNGYTQFPSRTLDDTLGVDRHPDLLAGERGPRDLLGEALIEAHRNELLCFAWFEYGFMAAHAGTDNRLVREKPEWLSEDIDGNLVAPNGFIWMNPVHPEVRAFLIRLVLDAVERYDLDGVQLDDRLAWPHYTMGYDAYTREVYAAEHGGEQPPDNPRDPDWLKWRADKVTEFAGDFYRALREARPDLLVSVSPAPYPWSFENYACDWPAWAYEGWFDEFVPQVYREGFSAFEDGWRDQLEAIGGRRRALLAGIRIVGSGPDTPWEELHKKLALTRDSRAGGHVLWFSRGVLEVYPDEIEAFYDVAGTGQATHPGRPGDWRPAPVVGEKLEDDQWGADVSEAGRYRLVAKLRDGWREMTALYLEPGNTRFAVPGAEAVELLRDRR